jgi:hypothetical protein
MPDIPPYQRLDPNAQEWGRWVTDSAQSNKNAIESLQTNTRSANQSLAAQLNRLQAQIANLAVQASYSNDVGTIGSTTSSGSYVRFDQPGFITFSLDQASRVRISGRIGISGFATATSGVGGSIDGSIGVGIDGSSTPYSKFTARSTTGLSALGGSGLSTQVQSNTSPSFSGTITLAAGSHTVDILQAFTYVVFFGNSGNVSLSNLSISVDVLGLA